MNRSILVCVALIFLVIAFSAGNGVTYHGGPESALVRNTGQQIVPSNSYTPHGSITISGNADFSSQGWPGNGTSVNPFVIEGLNITADANCIDIRHTTVYFEVRNCVISTISSDPSSFGIFFNDVIHGTVHDCIVDHHLIGIYLIYSSSCTLMNNTACDNNQYGFLLDGDDNYTLTNNTAYNNNHDGFRMIDLQNCIVMNNTATNNSHDGFFLAHVYKCSLTNNTATDNHEYGIHLSTGSDNILYLNRLGNNNVSNANDDGDSNIWDNGISCGNYWIDYSGTGIYQIPGYAGSVDNYPFGWVKTTPTDNMTVTLVLSGAGLVAMVILVAVVYRKRRL